MIPLKAVLYNLNFTLMNGFIGNIVFLLIGRQLTRSNYRKNAYTLFIVQMDSVSNSDVKQILFLVAYLTRIELASFLNQFRYEQLKKCFEICLYKIYKRLLLLNQNC